MYPCTNFVEYKAAILYNKILRQKCFVVWQNHSLHREIFHDLSSKLTIHGYIHLSELSCKPLMASSYPETFVAIK